MVVVVVYAVLLDIVPARAVEVRGLEYPRVLQYAWIRIDVFGHGTRLLSLDVLRTYRATFSRGRYPGPPLRRTSHHLRSHSLHRRIEERLLGYRGRIALIEVLNLQPAPDLGVLWRNPRVRDALPQRVPEIRACYVPDRPAIHEYRLVSHHNHIRIVEHRADQPAARSGLLAFRQRR